MEFLDAVEQTTWARDVICIILRIITPLGVLVCGVILKVGHVCEVERRL